MHTIPRIPRIRRGRADDGRFCALWGFCAGARRARPRHDAAGRAPRGAAPRRGRRDGDPGAALATAAAVARLRRALHRASPAPPRRRGRWTLTRSRRWIRAAVLVAGLLAWRCGSPTAGRGGCDAAPTRPRARPGTDRVGWARMGADAGRTPRTRRTPDRRTWGRWRTLATCRRAGRKAGVFAVPAPAHARGVKPGFSCRTRARAR